MFVHKVHHFLCTVLVVFIITFVFPGDFYSLYKNMLYNYILPPEIWDVLTGALSVTIYKIQITFHQLLYVCSYR